MDNLLAHTVHAQRMMGYQVNQDLQFSKKFGPYLDFLLNNCGDPYDDGVMAHTKDVEREVLNYFYSLFSSYSDKVWGYIGTGGSEGNLWGIYNGKRKLIYPIVVYSEDAHYSVHKAINITGLRSAKVSVNRKTGSWDKEHLTEIVRTNKYEHLLFVPTWGTTFYGGYDRLDYIYQALNKVSFSAHYYIHLDGAFGAPYKAYMYPDANKLLDSVDSLSFSLHKFYGCPIPSSIILCNQESMGESLHIDYIASHDSTICGSRSGLVPLMVKDLLTREEGYKQLPNILSHLADKLAIKLNELGYNSLRYPSSNCVVFDKPSKAIQKKYAISTQGDRAHIWVMPHNDISSIDIFLKDLCNENCTNL